MERAALEAEIAELREQVKGLVRTESRLNRARNQLDQQMRLFRGLYELSERNHAVFDLHRILTEILTFTLYELAYQRAVVFLAGARAPHLEVFVCDGYFEDDERDRVRRATLAPDDPLLAEVRDGKQLSWRADDDATRDRYRGFSERIGIDHFFAFPIVSGTETVGMFVVGNTAASERYHTRVELGDAAYGIGTVASQISAAVNKCRLFQALADERNSLDEKVRQRTRELSEANANLEHMNSLKSQFFANVSHELRTPLTLSIGPLEEVLKPSNALSAGDRNQYLRTVHANQLRLLKLINNLLDFAKLEAGKMTLAYQPQNIAESLRFYVGTFQAAARGRRLVMDVVVATAGETTLYVDHDKFENIIVNLLSNAFKFTPDGGRITVSVRESINKDARSRPASAGASLESINKDALAIDVTDTGIGIPPGSLAAIFDRFSQVDSSERRRYEGTGIGLAMVKELVALHGGTVTVASEPGVGSTFTVVLPRGKAHLDPSTIRSEDAAQIGAVAAHHLIDVVARDEDDADIDEDDALGGAGVIAARVLVVDDLPEMRRFIATVLRERGHRVTLARDGREGLAKAAALLPDLVISDVMMPGMTGYELCAAMKSDGGPLSHIPVILLSAKAEMAGKLEGLAHGADDYLVKPFSAAELNSRSENLIRNRRQERELAESLDRLQNTQRELVETSRRAGMADVATSVLHNVGNVLNSVNVSATLIEDRLGKHRANKLHRISDLLTENQERLEALFREARGQRLPEYLRQLVGAVDSDNAAIRGELESLRRGIEHIKAVIAMQQNLAKAPSGTHEVLSINETIEDALGLEAASYAAHSITVHRELGAQSRISIDRHKIVQIVTNLLSNARHAMSTTPPDRRRVIVRSRAATGAFAMTSSEDPAGRGRGALWIEVQDSGCGIPPENLNRIFNLGFTTKADGHGFGLHSSACFALELGGRLSASSEGIGKGACFRLELPLGR
jgi:two-component system, sensor histidine kinase ChiS